MLYLFQAVMKYFWLKVFYSKSSLQCNSVLTVNTWPNNGGYDGSIYKNGLSTEEIYTFLKDNLMEEQRTGKANPVLGLLEQMKNMTMTMTGFF